MHPDARFRDSGNNSVRRKSIGNGGKALRCYTALDNNSFISETIAVDWNLDFNTDTVYFGTVAGDSNGWSGKLRRIITSYNNHHGS